VSFTGEAAVLADTGVLPFAGTGSFAVLAASACGTGLGAADLTGTLLTLTLTGLAADSALTGGPGARPHRRLGSVAIAVAAVLVAGAFTTTVTPRAQEWSGTMPNARIFR
jgi:hypothetical protein